MTDDTPPDVRAYLDGVARHLRDCSAGEPIPPAWIRYLRQAARKPAGRTRGRPKTEASRERHETIAREVFAMQMRDLSWEKIASAAFDNGWRVTDLRALQRIFKKYSIELSVEELGRRLKAHDQREEEERRSGERP